MKIKETTMNMPSWAGKIARFRSYIRQEQNERLDAGELGANPNQSKSNQIKPLFLQAERLGNNLVRFYLQPSQDDRRKSAPISG